MSTITMPYSTCGIGLNTACISRTMMSKASMVADTGSLNHLLSTSGGMSRPPVDAPERMTMPSETPARLMKNSSPETGRPVNRPMASAMPVAPPVMRPAGSRNSATASE